MKQKIEFADGKKNTLTGILSNPKKTEHVPIIILCHGFSSSKNSSSCIALEKLFNKKNIATFRFDLFLIPHRLRWLGYFVSTRHHQRGYQEH